MSWTAKRFNGKSHKEYREATSTHHRKPRSLGGNGNEENLSELPRSRHSAWHDLFQNWCAERIAQEINDRYLDPDYVFVVTRRPHEDNRPADFVSTGLFLTPKGVV